MEKYSYSDVELAVIEAIQNIHGESYIDSNTFLNGDLGLDSLDAVEIEVALEKKFKISIDKLGSKDYSVGNITNAIYSILKEADRVV